MTYTRNAPAGAATLAGAVENRSVCETAQLSTSDSIIPAAERQRFRALR